MKKLFFIAAIAGAALVSCTKNELAPSATEQHEINFASPVTSLVTKGVDLVTGNLYPSSAPFWVFADHHMDLVEDFSTADKDIFTSYMRGNDTEGKYIGVMVSHNGGGAPGSEDESNATIDTYWKPATKYYWPMQGYLTFAAYSTGTATGLSGYKSLEYDVIKGLKLTEYTVSSENQYDLMLSSRADNKKKEHSVEGTTTTKNDGVEIQFNHALSAIKFAVRTKDNYLSPDGYTITLNSLSVQGAYTTADLIQFPGTDGTMWSAYKNDKSGTTPSSYAVTFANANPTLSTTETILCGSTDTDLVLLPQALNGIDHDVKVYMTYTVNHADINKPIQYTATLDLADNTNAQDATWDAGKRYLYTIIIGMEEIVFAPTIVTDWVTDTNPEVKEDINL